MTRAKRGIVDLNLCKQVASLCPAMALSSTSRKIERLFGQAFHGLEIGGRQFSLLVALALLGPCTVSRLADSVGLSPTTLSRNLIRLERMGIVQMVSGTDRRQRVVSLTTAGEQELARALQAWRSAMDELEDTIGVQRLDSLRNLLSQMRNLIEG